MERLTKKNETPNCSVCKNRKDCKLNCGGSRFDYEPPKRKKDNRRKA